MVNYSSEEESIGEVEGLVNEGTEVELLDVVYEEEEAIDRENETEVEEMVEETEEQREHREAIEFAQLVAEEIRGEINSDVDVDINFAMLDNEGEYIDVRRKGRRTVEMLGISEIIQTRRVRTTEQDNFSLQEQLIKFGQLQPIHVVEYGDRYVLLDGQRRLEELTNLGNTEVVAYIDGTIPPELVKYYEAIINGVAPYTFSEQIAYGKFFKENQSNVGYDIIEGVLGLRTGEFLKGLYIDTMKVEYMDTYNQVEKGKLTIEQGFKKIEKEREKLEKEAEEALNGDDALNSGEVDDQLRDKNDLAGLDNVAEQQELGNRKYLDPVLRRTVEQRDGGYCQCCEYGKGEPEFMGVFNVHHVIAVQYGGKDEASNLILLCSNCHTLVHDYESGRYMPEDTYDRFISVKKQVVLGNMLRTMRGLAIAEMRRKHPDTARVMDSGKITIGQAIKKQSLDLKVSEQFGGSPYQKFVDITRDLEYGGVITGELGELTWEVKAEEVTETDEGLVKEVEVETEDRE